MRVFLGLTGLLYLASQASAQQVALSVTNVSGATGSVSTNGGSALCSVSMYQSASATQNTLPGSTFAPNPQSGTSVPSTVNTATMSSPFNLIFLLPNNIGSLVWAITTNANTAQLQHKFEVNAFANGVAGATITGTTDYICDACAGGAGVCNVDNNQVVLAAKSNCAAVSRQYYINNLNMLGTNQCSFGFQAWNFVPNVFSNINTYLFKFTKAPAAVSGDPQILGMQGQDFQVHGIPDEIFNIVSYPSVQVNARFSYLESAECHDNYTACFAHPGTYISEEGFRIGKDKIRITAGSFKKGLTVSVNGKKTHQNVDLKSGAVELVNHRRVVVHTDIMKFTVTNSDKFLNQECELKDDKLVALGAERRQLRDNQRFHPEVPLHGLQGQTWRNVEYASGLDYEGSIMDYHVADGNLFGTDFVFNQFQA